MNFSGSGVGGPGAVGGLWPPGGGYQPRTVPQVGLINTIPKSSNKHLRFGLGFLLFYFMCLINILKNLYLAIA